MRDAEPALWAHSRTTPAPTASRARGGASSAGCAIEDYGAGRMRPHERTHPGPEGGPAAPDPRHPREHLADLLALLRPGRRAWEALGRRRGAAVGGGQRRRRDVHRLWRVADPAAIAAVQRGDARGGAADRRRASPLRDDAGLCRGDRRRRRAPLHADVPRRARGPGLTVFPTHRLVGGLDAARRQALAARCSATSRSARSTVGRSLRPGRADRCSSATSTAARARVRLTLKRPGDRGRGARGPLAGVPANWTRGCSRR